MEVLKNHATLYFDAKSINEGFARMAVMAFMSDMNPTLEQLEDVKTAVSEAVTNAIIHGYEEEKSAIVYVSGMIYRNEEGYLLQVIVEDTGKGIADIEKAMEPMFTTKPELERSGMGFAFMEAFMDELEVESKVNEGTKITMKKYIGKQDEILCAISQNL